MFRLFFLFCLSTQLCAEMLVLKKAPTKIIAPNYCLSSLFSEPEIGCISWNRYENAGPVTHQGHIYIGGTDGKLHVISQDTGLTQKRIALPGKLRSQPTLAGDSLLLGTDQGYVVSLNTHTWEQNWQQKLDAELPNPLLVSGDQVYLVSGLATLYALHLDTGDISWEQKRPFSAGLGLKALSNPLMMGDKLVVGNPSGKLEFRRLSDGDLLFDVAVGDPKKSFPNVATDATLLPNHQIAVAGFNQGLAILEASTGEISWTLALPNITRLIATDKLLIAAGPKELTAIDLNTQKITWRFSYLKGTPNRLIAKNSLLYFGSDQDALYVLDIHTGRPHQILGSGLGFAGDFDFSSEHTLFALSTAGYLYQYGRKNNSSCCGFN